VLSMLISGKIKNINEKNSSGHTALYGAAFGGHDDVVSILLSFPDIKVNDVDNKGNTALHIASINGHTDTVKTLLMAPGIDINKVNKNGQTALRLAKTQKIRYMIINKIGISTPWKRMSNIQKNQFKIFFIVRMLEKMKREKNNTFKDTITLTEYKLKNLAPVNSTNNNLGSLGLILNNRNEPTRFVNARALKSHLNERVRNGQPRIIRGVLNENYSLINITPAEYKNIVKNFNFS